MIKTVMRPKKGPTIAKVRREFPHRIWADDNIGGEVCFIADDIFKNLPRIDSKSPGPHADSIIRVVVAGKSYINLRFIGIGLIILFITALSIAAKFPLWIVLVLSVCAVGIASLWWHRVCQNVFYDILIQTNKTWPRVNAWAGSGLRGSLPALLGEAGWDDAKFILAPESERV